MGEVRIVRAGLDRVEALGPLWRSLQEHHHAIGADVPGIPLRDPEDSWARRRVEYFEWLAEPGAFTKAQLDAFLDRLVGEYELTGEKLNDAFWSRQFMSPADHTRADYLVQTPVKIVESVIGNLLRNAIAYTDNGEVRVVIRDDTVVIEDTGPGMPADEIGKLFKPFMRRQRRRGGYGVGLTIVKRLTERFGWLLSIDSEPGRGTRVEVRFPEARTRSLI